jgi:RNAse (barnase) inhibitor barstar
MTDVTAILPWALVDDYTDAGEDHPVVAECAEIIGLFVEPAPPRARERYTLLGCAPAGLLREALGGGEPWLGNLVVGAVHPPGQQPAGCQPYGPDSCSCTQELWEVRLEAYRPSTLGADLVDIDLTGLVGHCPEFSVPAVEERPPAESFRITAADGTAAGTFRAEVGVYREVPDDPEYPVTLLGCRPGPQLAAAIADPSRPIIAHPESRAFHGGFVMTLASTVNAQVTAVRPSSYGTGLVDVTFDGGFLNPMPTGTEDIWRLWQTTGPQERNLWASRPPMLRQHWAGAAMTHATTSWSPDRPPGTVYHLDGRYVTDVPAFWCALGEAVNGPGGYFGWNLDALTDCLRGRFGAATPFTLHWHDAATARAHLNGAVNPRTRTAGPSMADLLEIFKDANVDVRLM